MSRLAFCKMREFGRAGFIWEGGEPGLYHVEDGGSPGVGYMRGMAGGRRAVLRWMAERTWVI